MILTCEPAKFYFFCMGLQPHKPMDPIVSWCIISTYQ